MRPTISRAIVACLALATSLALTAGTAGAAAPVPVRPKQPFVGLVNGRHAGAVVYVLCPGPIRPGETGHPLGNQRLSVRLGALPPLLGGFTGSLGSAIVATFREDPSASDTFTAYGVPQPIPLSLSLPCGGSGLVRFAPAPPSVSARSDEVAVRYVNIGV